MRGADIANKLWQVFYPNPFLPMSPLLLLHPFRAGNRRNVAPFRSHPMHKFKTYIGRACCMASASCFQAFSNLVQQALKRLQQAPRRFPSWSCGQHHLACQTRVLCRIWRTPGCRPSPGGSKIAYDRSRGKTACRGSHLSLIHISEPTRPY